MSPILTRDACHYEEPTMKRFILRVLMRTLIGCLLCLGVLFSGQLPVYASEGAFSYYFPGAFASFAVAVAPEPGFQFVDQTLYYHADVDKAVLQGRVNLSLKTTALINYLGGSYAFEDPVLGGRLQLFAAAPVGYVSVKSSTEIPPLGSIDVSDRDFDIGDSISLGAIHWKKGDFHFKLGEMVFIPTGAYSTTSLTNMANVGRNYWGFDTFCAATWLSQKTGTEVSVMPGILFNTENTSTDYRTGNEFHVDFMLNQFLAKSFALGAQGYYYKQVTGDSGDGALLGDFKGESYGFGPALLWMPGCCDGKLSLIAKWLFDSHQENRMKGDYGQLIICKKF